MPSKYQFSAFPLAPIPESFLSTKRSKLFSQLLRTEGSAPYFITSPSVSILYNFTPILECIEFTCRGFLPLVRAPHCRDSAR